MANMDTLNIKITADAKSASDSINKLCGSIRNLQTSLGSSSIKNLNNLSKSMANLNTAMSGLSNVKLPAYTRTAKGIKKLEEINSVKLSLVANSLTPLANSLFTLSSMLNAANFDNSKILNLVNAITRLSNANTASLSNIGFDSLGKGITGLANRLSNAKSVSSNTIQLTNAVARLAQAGSGAPIVSAELSTLGNNLKKFMVTMSGAPKATQETIEFTNAIGLLANAGAKTLTTAKNLGYLADELKKFFTTMSSAPTVNKNIIDMTNALANLAQQSRGVGTAGRSLNGAFGNMGGGIGKTNKGITSLASAFGKFYASCFLLIRGMKYVRESIDISSQLTELQNVVVHTFAQDEKALNDFTDTAITDFGMSELSAKQFATRFQAMGNAMDLSARMSEKSMSVANAVTEKFGNGMYSATSKMSDMSINLTKLTADMASFYDVEQSAVAEDLESIFTGQTRPLRTYGIDLTQATLKEWALNNGLDANISKMSQAEKTMLRYQYVMSATKEVMGDFSRTQDTWHNQLTILKSLFQNLGKTIGTAFVNMLSPLVKTLNAALIKINEFAEKVVNSLGKIFGWKIEISNGTLADDFEDASDGAGDLADGTKKAADNAKKLKQQLQGFDELNVLTTPKDSDSGSGKGSGAGGTGSGANGNDSAIKVTDTKGIFDSDWDTLYKLGKGVGDAIKKGLDDIEWEKVYKSADKFGTGLADFLNGLFEKDDEGNSVFKALGKTIAGSLNTVLHAVFSFANTFDWENFGETLGDGITEFFKDFDWELAADTLNKLTKGLTKTFTSAVKAIEWKTVFGSLFTFLSELDVGTLNLMIGAIAWKMGGKALVASAIADLLAKEVAITSLSEQTISAKATIGLSIVVALEAFKLGNWLYKNVSAVTKFSDAIVAWITKDGDEDIALAKTISVALTGLAIALPIAKIADFAIGAAKAGGIGTALSTWATESFLPAISTFFATTLPKLLPVAGYALAITLAVAIGFKLGKKIYESLTGEQAQGGIKDLIDMDISWDEVGKALSDGAVVDFTLTPLVKWISGDDTITTDEVIDAGADLIKDVVDGIKKIPTNVKETVLDVTAKITSFTEDIKDKASKVIDNFKANFTTWKDSLSDKVSNFKANLTTFKDSLSDKVTNFKAKLTTWSDSLKDKILNFKAKLTSFIKSFKSSEISGMKAKFTSFIKSFKSSEISSMKAKFTSFTSSFSSKIISGFKAKLTSFTNAIKASDLIINFKAKITGFTNKVSDTVKNIFGIGKKDGGAFYNGAWHNIAQYASGGIPQHGTMFVAGEHGSEVVGDIGGRTEVLNQSQMASVMYDAVLSGMSTAMRNSGNSQQPIQVYLDGKVVFDSTRKYANDYFTRNGKPAFNI